MWKLVIEDDEGKRTVVPLSRGEYSIGRREGNVIRLTERNVSREHARLCRKSGAGDKVDYLIEDLTSFNGVFVNGLRITHAHDLAHGDLVQIGDYRMVVQDESVTEVPRPPSSADWKQTVPNAPQPRGSDLLDRPNRLVMLAGPNPGAEFALDRDRMTIGRAEDAGISVNHNSVSRLHCEVHALGDGRFEIVDKGSSNGVRVNGADLRRGIIEPGDLIELGDVRFKFVGAGQIFRPAEGQPFAVIADRATGTALRGRGSYRALPIAVFTVVVAAGAAGAWLSARPRMRGTSSSAGTTSPEQAALVEATKLCRAGDCEQAHTQLDLEIPEGSRWRDTSEFKQVESDWAESLMHRADSMSDLAAKRELYQRVAQTIAVDAIHRKTAADRLQQLDTSIAANPPTNALELPVAPTAAPTSAQSRQREREREDASAAARAEAARKAAAVPVADPGASMGTASANSASPTPPVNAEERERQLALQGTPDARWSLKQQLEARVHDGKASDAEIRLLISTCKDLGDKGCVQQARAALTQRSQ